MLHAVPDPQDPRWLAAVARGEKVATRAFVRHFEGPVFAVLTRVLGPQGHADVVEDLAQETFVRALGALPRFRIDGPAKVSTWLLTIATRRALSYLERARNRPASSNAESASARTDVGDRVHLRASLERAVAELTPDQRAVFVLRDYHGMTETEVSEALDLDVNAVKSRLFRARQRLRRVLAEEREDHGRANSPATR